MAESRRQDFVIDSWWILWTHINGPDVEQTQRNLSFDKSEGSQSIGTNSTVTVATGHGEYRMYIDIWHEVAWKDRSV